MRGTLHLPTPAGRRRLPLDCWPPGPLVGGAELAEVLRRRTSRSAGRSALAWRPRALDGRALTRDDLSAADNRMRRLCGVAVAGIGVELGGRCSSRAPGRRDLRSGRARVTASRHLANRRATLIRTLGHSARRHPRYLLTPRGRHGRGVQLLHLALAAGALAEAPGTLGRSTSASDRRTSRRCGYVAQRGARPADAAEPREAVRLTSGFDQRGLGPHRRPADPCVQPAGPPLSRWPGWICRSS